MQSKSASASASVRAPKPGVHIAVADIMLNARLGAALAISADLAAAGAEEALVVVTDAPSREFGRRALDIGPAGLDSRDPSLILAAALLTTGGYSITGPGLPDAMPARAHLSAREQQVAALLLEGASNKVIARALGISVHTAKFHVTAVLDKVGARNRADAVSMILREGLVTL